MSKLFIRYTSIIFTLLLSFNAHAQQVKVYAISKPLNKVFFDLKDQYGIQFSFNDAMLSSCIINDSTTYENPVQAVASLVQTCGFEYHLKGNIFIITAQAKAAAKPTNNIPRIFNGQVTDKFTKEPLPFANLKIGDQQLSADLNGRFSLFANNTNVTIHASHLGYYILDSNIATKTFAHIELTPSAIGLKEVEIHDKQKPYMAHLGTQPALIKLNHLFASFIPGNNDNIVYNALRLQPGIMASGEQSSDYIIWGSYIGQTLIEFDGIPIFNINTGKDNLGIINPLILEDIEVYKSNFGAETGGRIGGYVRMTGKQGNADKLSGTLNLNNQTASTRLNIPVGGNSALQVAFRQTLFNFLNTDRYFLPDKGTTDFYHSGFSLRDMNLKFSSALSKTSQLTISLRNDQNSEIDTFYENKTMQSYNIHNSNTRKQYGGSLHYSKQWAQLGTTHLKTVYANMTNQIRNTSSISKVKNMSHMDANSDINNSVQEQFFELSHQLPAKKHHQMQFGLRVSQDQTSLNYLIDQKTYKTDDNRGTLVSAYIKDRINLFSILYLEPGLRIDHPYNAKKNYFQPRIKLSAYLNDHLKLHAAWGKYVQFLNESSISDNYGNYYYYWQINGFNTLPATQSYHSYLGASYSNGGFMANLDLYHKKTSGLIRYVNIQHMGNSLLSKGDGQVKGIDVYLKQQIHKHQVWLSYSLAQAVEYFDYFTTSEYQRAPQDQRHEIKGAFILNLKPWYFSASYVYGSGFPYLIPGRNQQDVFPYNRMDISAMYRFSYNHIAFEGGASIINLLNQTNIKYNNFSTLPDQRIIYRYGMPFTPSVFLNISF